MEATAGTGGPGRTGGTTGGGRLDAVAPERSARTSCMQSVLMGAEAAWRTAQMTSLSSLTTLRQVLSALSRVNGDKTIVLISGGWPLDDRDEISLITTVAADARGGARDAVHRSSCRRPRSRSTQRMMSLDAASGPVPLRGPLETLAGMTGGGTFRAEVGAEGAFERLGRELAGYYRIGIEKDAGRSRRQEPAHEGPGGARRDDGPGPRDFRRADLRGSRLGGADGARRWSRRRRRPASACGSRATWPRIRTTTSASRLSSPARPRDSSRATRLFNSGPGPRRKADHLGRTAARRGDRRSVAVLARTSRCPPAATSSAWRSWTAPVVSARSIIASKRVRVTLGEFSAIGPLLVRVPTASPGADPRLALDGVRQDERLALEVDLEARERQVDDARNGVRDRLHGRRTGAGAFVGDALEGLTRRRRARAGDGRHAAPAAGPVHRPGQALVGRLADWRSAT